MFSVALILLLASGSCVYSIDLIQSDSVVLQPGHTLTIRCQVSGYSLTDGSYATGWIRQREGKPMDWIFHQWGGSSGNFYKNNAFQNKFSFSRDMSAGRVTISGQNLQPEDTAVYYCVRNNYDYFDYWGKGTMVTVTTATVTGPTVFPLQPCDVNDGTDMVSFACLASGFTPSSLTFSWTANDSPLTGSIQYPPVLKNDFYTGVSQLRVRRQDINNTQSFKCNVAHAGGNGQGTITIVQTNQLPTLKVSASDGENDITFSCLAKEFSPKAHEFKWLKNNEEIAANIHNITTFDKTENGPTIYSAASFLTVNSQEVTGADEYMCQFKGKGGAEPILNATVSYRVPCNLPCMGNPVENVVAKIIPPSPEDMFQNQSGKLTCTVTTDNVRVDKIYWLNGDDKEFAEGAIEPKQKKGTFNSSLLITYDEWHSGLLRKCYVEVDGEIEPLKRIYKRTSGGRPQRPSVFMLPPIEHTKKETVTLTCYVKDFFPADIYVSWLVDDERAGSEYKFSTTNPVENSGTYFVYSHLSITATQWEKKDTVYSCAIYHESVVNTTKTIIRSIGHRSLETTNLVNLNMNIPETCKA